MGLYKLCKPSEKGLNLYWSSSIPQKYFSKSISLLLNYLWIWTTVFWNQSDNQHSFTLGWLPTAQTWFKRYTCTDKNMTCPSRWAQRPKQRHCGHTAKFRVFWIKHQNRAPQSMHFAQLGMILNCESGDTLAQAAQRSVQVFIPTSVQSKVQQGREQRGPVEGVPAHTRRLELYVSWGLFQHKPRCDSMSSTTFVFLKKVSKRCWSPEFKETSLSHQPSRTQCSPCSSPFHRYLMNQEAFAQCDQCKETGGTWKLITETKNVKGLERPLKFI